MPQFNERLRADIDRFCERVYTDPIGVLDPDTLHHEFVSKNHGRKLDYDKIDSSTDFYIEWVAIYARALLQIYPTRPPDALVGIANGANRLARSVGNLLGILALETTKVDEKTVALNEDAIVEIDDNNVKFAVTIEDVGTTGGTTCTAVEDLHRVGVPRVESVNFHQRNLVLPRLETARTPHYAVIREQLPMFSPEECLNNPDGYCAQGKELVRHGQ